MTGLFTVVIAIFGLAEDHSELRQGSLKSQLVLKVQQQRKINRQILAITTRLNRISLLGGLVKAGPTINAENLEDLEIQRADLDLSIAQLRFQIDQLRTQNGSAE